MNSTFAEGFKFSKQWEPSLNNVLVRNHLLGRFVRSGTFREDVKECTDVVLEFPNKKLKIAQRVRDIANTRRERDFTIRCKVQSGAQTEMDKLKSSGVDLYVYAWVDVAQQRLMEYIVVDVPKFLQCGILDGNLRTRQVFGGNTMALFTIIEMQDSGCLIGGYKYPLGLHAGGGDAIALRWLSSDEYFIVRSKRMIETKNGKSGNLDLR